MQTRFDMGKVQPAAYKALKALDDYNKASSIDPLHREMIKIRASQINGCAYCLDMHAKEARRLGETEQRIIVMSAWREAGTIFSEEERLLLAMTEEITLIHQHGLSDDLYDQATGLWGEEKTAQVIMAISTINAWNRLGVALQLHPKADAPEEKAEEKSEEKPTGESEEKPDDTE